MFPWRCPPGRLCSHSPGRLLLTPTYVITLFLRHLPPCLCAFSATDISLTFNSVNVFMQSVLLAYIGRRRRPLHSQNQPSTIRFYLRCTYTPPYAAVSLTEPFSFNSGPLRSSGVGPCHSAIERTLLRWVIGREPHLSRFQWSFRGLWAINQ